MFNLNWYDFIDCCETGTDEYWIYYSPNDPEVVEKLPQSHYALFIADSYPIHYWYQAQSDIFNRGILLHLTLPTIAAPFRIQAAQNQVKFILSLHLSVKVHHLSLVCFSLSRPKLQQKILFNNSISSIFDSHPRHISHMNCRFSFQRGAIFHWILPPYLTSWGNIAQSNCYAMLVRKKEVMKATIFTSLPSYCFVLNRDQRKENISFLETKYFDL